MYRNWNCLLYTSVKVAQESKVELKGNGDSGIVFNVIVPQSNNDNNVE